MASGVIVKLKSVGSLGAPVSAAAQGNPARLSLDSSWRTQARLAATAFRQQVPYVAVRPTAFAAHVLRADHPIPLADAQAQAERLRRDPDVEWAIPNLIEKPASVGPLTVDPADPGYAQQTWLHARDVGLRGVADFPKAWLALNARVQAGQALAPVAVGLLDSGVLPHPDLAGRFWPGYDFVSVAEYARDGDGLDNDPTDPGTWLTAPEIDANRALYGDCAVRDSDWHGLALAGVLAANTNNGQYGAGILAPLSGPVVLPVRVAGLCGAEVSDIVEGMLWAAGLAYQGTPTMNAHPVRVINLSFGGNGSCADSGVRDAAWLYRQTIAALKARGVLVVASAGNGDANGALAQPTRPANCPGVLAVTALHEQGFKASYANLLDAAVYHSVAVDGGDVDGTGLLTTQNTGKREPNPNGYIMDWMGGTSLSAPAAAGVAAMMLAIDPYLSVDELIEGLTSRALPHISRAEALSLGMPDLPDCVPNVAMAQCYCSTATCGAGRLDAEGAIQYAQAQLAAHPTGTTNLSGPTAVSYFTPARAQLSSTSGSTSSGGGGGGAMDPSSLAVLAMLIWLTFIGGGRR